ncbi:MAG: chaperone NapD [Gammaproteobacteria bacterium]|nr:chaperone NapD [Gammaproteobacteria bacterium]
MNISGVLVHAYPEKAADVSRRLESMEGVEVHANTDEGKIVVTIEKSDDKSVADTLLELQVMPDVLNASMVYHQFED